MLSILKGNEPKWFDFEFVREGKLKPIKFKLKLKPITGGEIEEMKQNNISTSFDKKTHLQVQQMDIRGLLKDQRKKVAESILDWKGDIEEKFTKELAKKFIDDYATTVVGTKMKTIKYFDEDGNETGQTLEKEVDQSLEDRISEITRKVNNFLGEAKNLTTT